MLFQNVEFSGTPEKIVKTYSRIHLLFSSKKNEDIKGLWSTFWWLCCKAL